MDGFNDWSNQVGLRIDKWPSKCCKFLLDMVLMGSLQTSPWLLTYFNTCTDKRTLKADITSSSSLVKCIFNERVCYFTPCVSMRWCFHGSSQPAAAALTWGHPGIRWRLLSGVGLFPVKVIVPALAVPARWQRPLKITIACEKRKTFILLLQLFH